MLDRVDAPAAGGKGSGVLVEVAVQELGNSEESRTHSWRNLCEWLTFMVRHAPEGLPVRVCVSWDDDAYLEGGVAFPRLPRRL